MNFLWKYILGGCFLIALGLFLWVFSRMEKEGKANWKAYPGFTFHPSEEVAELYFSDSSPQKRRLLLYMMIASVFLCGALVMVALNVAFPLRSLTLGMRWLPFVFLLLQETELALALVRLQRSGKTGLYRTCVLVKWIPLLLYVGCLFISLFIRGWKL